MRPFLSYVAEDILKKYGDNLSAITVVFPNKRASLFLNQELAVLSGRPVWSPNYITISELFRQYSSLAVADPLKAIIELHKSFTSITRKAETIDQFFGWGQLLLADFDDIDKNEADASKVFANVRDWHEFDDVSYLTDEQRRLLQRFFKNFNSDESTLRQRFRDLWCHLYAIYTDYRQRLRNQGLAYEGMLYRDALANEHMQFPSDHYLFVGFNMLHPVEQTLFRRMQQQGKAAFYWDFDRHYITPTMSSPQPHEAGVYIRQLLERFPNELDTKNEDIYNNLDSPDKQITYISALTEDIQARYISDWLADAKRREAGNRTAIVLCDENLLPTAIHCIPTDVSDLNVTTGFPLRLTPIVTLISQLLTLQLEGYSIRQDAFRQYYVKRLMRHSYIRYLLDQDAEHTDSDRPSDYTDVWFLNRHTSNSSILHWLCDIVRHIAKKAGEQEDQLFQESLFRMYTLLNRLSELVDSGEFDVTQQTLQRFINQLTASTTIPFHGEPAIGIQLMGVLETRNLDFDHLLILSCNEGNMPKGVNDSSFIPHAIRKAYGLTTIDNKVAIYSYYFHRMLQRCGDITIMYNKSTEGTGTGEMSQFMLQLLVELRSPISRLTLHAGQSVNPRRPQAIEKDERVVSRLAHRKFSPTAINTYLRCQLRFYYKYVAGIMEPDNQDEETVDNRVFGNIFHRAAELMYDNLLPKGEITADDIDKLLRDKSLLNSVVAQAINEKLFHRTENLSQMPSLNGMQLINKEVITTYLVNLLHLDRQLVPFQVIGHEQPIRDEICPGVTVEGIIDRIDLVTHPDGSRNLRIVDYKTGRQPREGVKTIEEIFTFKKIDKAHSDYILQAMLYAILAADNTSLPLAPRHTSISPALLFIQHAQREGYDPVIHIGDNPVRDAKTEYGEEFMSHLRQVIHDMLSPDKPFSPAEQESACDKCPYKNLCH